MVVTSTSRRLVDKSTFGKKSSLDLLTWRPWALPGSDPEPSPKPGPIWKKKGFLRLKLTLLYLKHKKKPLRRHRLYWADIFSISISGGGCSPSPVSLSSFLHLFVFISSSLHLFFFFFFFGLNFFFSSFTSKPMFYTVCMYIPDIYTTFF